jgi:hypothetical protein
MPSAPTSKSKVVYFVVAIVICFLAFSLTLAWRDAREAAHQADSNGRLSVIGLALRNYQSSHGAFPVRAICGVDGKPLLSWRVTLLPYFEASTDLRLYKEFHLDEPWDSEHNLKLIDKMPTFFDNPDLSNKTETNYLAVVGKGTFFEGERGTTPDDVTDGLENTIVLVEADTAVPWTKPQELEFDASNPRKQLESFRPNGFLALFADGRVRLQKKDKDAETIRGLMTRSGGEKVSRE